MKEAVQYLSRRLSAAAGRFQTKVRSCGICGGQVTLGRFGFLPLDHSTNFPDIHSKKKKKVKPSL
jgi:hypothetical protein